MTGRPTFNPDTGGVADSSSDDDRPRNPIIGTYHVPPVPTQGTVHGSTGSYGPGSAPSYQWKPYRDRDLFTLLQQITRQGSILDLQFALVQAGFLDDDVSFGYIDGDTEDAMRDLLAVANQNGLNWQDVLSQSAQSGQLPGGGHIGGGSGGGSLGPTVISLPNRDDVIAGARDTAMSLGGEAIDDDLAESIADHTLDVLRTQQERQVQRQLAYDGPDGGVLFTEGNPDPGRLLEEEFRRRRPDLVAEKGARDTGELWQSIAGGPL